MARVAAWIIDFKKEVRKLARKSANITITPTTRGTVTVRAEWGEWYGSQHKVKTWTGLDSAPAIQEAVEDAFAWWWDKAGD